MGFGLGLGLARERRLGLRRRDGPGTPSPRAVSGVEYDCRNYGRLRGRGAYCAAWNGRYLGGALLPARSRRTRRPSRSERSEGFAAYSLRPRQCAFWWLCAVAGSLTWTSVRHGFCEWFGLRTDRPTQKSVWWVFRCPELSRDATHHTPWEVRRFGVSGGTASCSSCPLSRRRASGARRSRCAAPPPAGRVAQCAAPSSGSVTPSS